eukprot:scaffold35915_cov69-Phaeocystis_antarctica.AAC.5
MKLTHCVLAVALLAAPSAGLIAGSLAPHRLGGTQAVLRRPHPAAAHVRMGPGLFHLAGLAAPKQVAVAVGLNSGIAALGVAKKQGMLTPSGLLHAWGLGVILWATLGWRGWSTCVLYLLAGSAVTKVKKAKKESMGIAEGRGGKRGPENVRARTRPRRARLPSPRAPGARPRRPVWGSAATAALCALGTVAWPVHAPALRLGFVASLATKLSDTCESEIGKAYGKSTFLITTLKPVPPGTEGAISLEGTAAGVVGSIVLVGYALGCGLVSRSAMLPCLVAAFVATKCESLIGALAQDRFALLTNEVVNFINTLIGATLAIALGGPMGAL